MPLQRVILRGQPHYRWGETGYPYAYVANNNESRKAAKEKALAQGRAIEANKRQK